MRLTEHGLALADIADLPNTTVGNGLHSITEGKVLIRFEPLVGRWFSACARHGALLSVGSHIWRCPECHEGCFKPNVHQVVNITLSSEL